MSRYFFPRPQSLPIALQTEVMLDGPEAHHLLNVMRAKPGETVTLFDGEGWEYTATVASVSKRAAVLQITNAAEISREPDRRLVLGVSLPKGDRQRIVIEKCTELGVAEIVPLHSQRSVAKVDGKAADRLRRFVLEATKQCGRTTLMQIGASQSLADFLNAKPADVTGVFASLQGETRIGALMNSLAPTASVFAAVGPEGGWTSEEETAAVSAGWVPVRLTPSVLRVETAAGAIAALCLC